MRGTKGKGMLRGSPKQGMKSVSETAHRSVVQPTAGQKTASPMTREGTGGSKPGGNSRRAG